jgi:hypothetical protein
MCFACVFPFFKIAKFKEILKTTWGAPEDAPLGRRLLCYGLLENLFEEFANYPMVGQPNELYRKYAMQCRVHLETTMSKLDLFLPASYENILALLLAVSSHLYPGCNYSQCNASTILHIPLLSTQNKNLIRH